MAGKAGALLWRRMHLVLSGPNNDIDTGLKLPVDARAFLGNSPGEPRFDADGAIGSRIQVIPLAPVGAWVGNLGANPGVNAVYHGEPYLDPTTDTIHVLFGVTGGEGIGEAEINVLFWNPHSLIGPGDADLYV